MLFISRDIPQLNGEIRDKELRVITADGQQLGIMSAKDALHEAEIRGQDLVKIAPQAKPPVVKIMDYSKFRYEQAKREKENRKKQKTIDTKEIRLSLNIDIGDFNTKVNQAKKFLDKGDKLKVSLRLRGREWLIQISALQICKDLRRRSAKRSMLIKPLNWRAGRFLCSCLKSRLNN